MNPKLVATGVAVVVLGGVGASMLRAGPAPATKAYVVGEITVTNPEAYKPYVAAITPIITRYGGAYLARGGAVVPLEGTDISGRIVVIEFPSLTAAQAFESSPEYARIAPMRRRASTGRFFIVEGVTRAQ